MTMTNLDTRAEVHALVVAVMVMVIGHSSNYLTSFAVITDTPFDLADNVPPDTVTIFGFELLQVIDLLEALLGT